MRASLLGLVALVVVIPSLARAQPGRTAPTHADSQVEPETAPAGDVPLGTTFAIAINPPFRWSSAIAGSAYMNLSKHHAIRANVAVYNYEANAVGELVSILAGGEGSEASYGGSIVDVGAGWTYFPRKLWDGMSFEVGLVRRSANTHTDDEFASPEIVDRDTRTYALRGLIGWSWLMYDRLFISVAAGASKGYTYGRESSGSGYYDVPATPLMTSHVAEWSAAVEGYFRVGVAFDVGSR